MIGKTIGNYRIVGLLGEGGMGQVFLAAHPELGRKAAVKVLREDLVQGGQGAEHVRRFLNEARAADAIHHPAIVKVLDLGTMPSGAPYIVMELLEGETLGARLQRRGRFAPRAAVDIVARAAEALAAAHAAGIVHRDLKPDNLFLVTDAASRKDVVKVLDFGIAKLGGPWQKPMSLKTQSGVIMGTPVYMSPELCSGARHVDHRSDIYSLGIILYEMLCGEPPFRSEGFGELAHLHLSVAPTPPRARNPEIPEALSAVVLRALAKDPKARFASMAELSAALAPWTGVAGAAVPARPRGRGGRIVVGAVVAAGVAGALFWSLRTPAPTVTGAEPKAIENVVAAPAAPPAPAPAAPPAPAPAPAPEPARAATPVRGGPPATTSRRRRQPPARPDVAPATKRREPVPL